VTSNATRSPSRSRTEPLVHVEHSTDLLVQGRLPFDANPPEAHLARVEGNSRRVPVRVFLADEEAWPSD